MTASPQERRAETFELFFDLMFVFAITQITHLIETASAVQDWIAAIAILMFLWWMYSGFVWLASNSTQIARLAGVLLTAMLAFFILAAGIPGLHGGDTLLVGLAALAVVAIHIAGFALITHDVTPRMVLSFGWTNTLAALLLLTSGYAGDYGWVLLIGVAVIPVAMSMLYAARQFTVVPSHFVERHGLLMIIVFGESIIAVGTTLGAHPEPSALLEAGLVILLVIALWLSWFNHDDRRSEEVLHHTASERRGRIALIAYYFGFALMILGILLLAAGMKLHFLGHAQPAPWIAAALAVYFLGMALFRWEVGLAGAASRVVGAVIALAIWPLTTGDGLVAHAVETHAPEAAERASALLPLGLALALSLVMLAVDRWQIGPARRGA
ncbi:MAG: low temperature requirement protein A [Rhodobacteraceae bacterium]|nr:low temperature requirement protein A [Paracoccaceae bacterium]